MRQFFAGGGALGAARACSGQAEMIEVIDRIKPLLIVLMHYFVPSVLQRFLRRMGGRFAL